MTSDDITTWLLAAGGLSGFAALIRAFVDRRQGIASSERAARAEEREDRRDTIADRDSLLDRLLEDVQGYRAEVSELRGRVEFLERDARLKDDHIDLLEHHIWQQLPPPPPPRPGG